MGLEDMSNSIIKYIYQHFVICKKNVENTINNNFKSALKKYKNNILELSK